MANVLETLRENLVPTVNTFVILIEMLRLVVREIEELSADSVGIGTETAKNIVAEMINLLSGSIISNFPIPVVENLIESITNMMIKGKTLALAGDLSELYDAAQTTLLERLTDTLPGQIGFLRRM